MKLSEIKPLDTGKPITCEYEVDLPNKHVDIVSLDGNGKLGEDPIPMGIEIKLSLIGNAGGKVLEAESTNDKLDQLALLVQLTTITLMSDIEQLSKKLGDTLIQEGTQ